MSRWFIERVHELGLARTLRASYSDPPGPFDGLLPMLREALGCQQMDRQAIEAHLRALPEPLRPGSEDELDGLARLLGEGPGEVGARTAEPSHLARYELMQRQLGRMSQRRPLVIAVEEAHLGVEALFFLRYLMRRAASSGAIMFVLTAQPTPLESRQLEAALLEELCATPDVVSCQLEPLPEEDLHALVQSRMAAAPSLVEAIVGRARGVPLFALQLLDEFIEQDALVPGPEGWRQRARLEVSLPEDIAGLWRGRLERLLTTHEATGPALEIAAALGSQISRREWEAACARYGSLCALWMIELWERVGLVARVSDASFGLVSPTLRQVLLERAGTGGAPRSST